MMSKTKIQNLPIFYNLKPKDFLHI